jgi:predicted transposase YbfD/YdcC
MLILDVLDDIPDPRGYNAIHDLTDVLFVALAAMLCGAVHCTEMAWFAETRLELLRQFVPLKNGAPSHDTFSRVFRALDPEAFNRVFSRLMSAFGAQARQDTGRQVAIDGKSLRRAYEKGRAYMPALVVTAFDCETFLSLSQEVAVAGEGGEAEAAIRAVEILSLKGALVSGDALHCHRRMTQAVRSRDGHYLLAIKDNQSKLAKAANAALDAAAAKPRTPIAETHDIAHDREELRRCFVTRFRQSPGRNALEDLVAVARVERWRTVGAKTEHTVHAYALSKLMSPA